MSHFFVDLIRELLEWYLDIKFWFKKRKRRKFEKENNLPKKLMVYPSTKIYLAVIVLGFICIAVFMFFIYPGIKEAKTRVKLTKISEILEKEKDVLGAYPKDLKMIIRNNPLRKNITKDYWNNKFLYKLSRDGKSYILFSLGKDGIPNTYDDIVSKN